MANYSSMQARVAELRRTTLRKRAAACRLERASEKIQKVAQKSLQYILPSWIISSTNIGDADVFEPVRNGELSVKRTG